MKELSVAQEYFICMLNGKGKIEGLGKDKLICFVAGGLLELQLAGCIAFDNKTIFSIGELPEEMDYLKSIYNVISKDESIDMDEFMKAYDYEFNDRQLNELAKDIGDFLESIDFVKTIKSGVFKKKKTYFPKREIINKVIDKMRSNMLEPENMTEETAALFILLDRSMCLKEYFSIFERNDMRENLIGAVKSGENPHIRYMVECAENIVNMMSVMNVSLIVN